MAKRTIEIQPNCIYVNFGDTVQVYKFSGTIEPEVVYSKEELEQHKKDYEKYKNRKLIQDECLKRFAELGITSHVMYAMSSDLDLDMIYRRGTFTLMYHGWGIEEFKKKLTNPTVWDIVVAANEAIEKTKDFHHVFLEGIYKNGSAYYLSMGS